MKYKMHSPFAGMKKEFIFSCVQVMYRYEISSSTGIRLLTADEEMQVYLMQIGAMNSEIGVY